MDNQLTLSLSEQEINTILAGLSELPFKTASGLISKILQEANEQIAARTMPVDEE